MSIDELNQNMPLDTAAKSIQAPQRALETSNSLKTEKLGSTQVELDAGPAYTVEISEQASELFDQSQREKLETENKKSVEKKPERESITNEETDGAQEKSKQMTSLSSYSDEQLEQLMEKGQISRVKYNVEMSRRTALNSSGKADPKKDGEANDTAIKEKKAEPAEQKKEKTEIEQFGAVLDDMAKSGLKNREIDRRENKTA